MKNVKDLINILTLKDLGNQTFSGISKTIGSPRVFGGQVLAQALNAAYRTIPEERVLHSLHSYFLLPGNLEIPITYKVNEMRNGGSFSTRITDATASIDALTTASGSLSTRVTTAETELGNTLISGSAQIASDISGSMAWTIAGDDDSSTVSTGQTVTIAGTAPISTVQGSRTVTISVDNDGITDTHLAYNTGQHLTTTSKPLFGAITASGDISSSATIIAEQLTTSDDLTVGDTLTAEIGIINSFSPF